MRKIVSKHPTAVRLFVLSLLTLPILLLSTPSWAIEKSVKTPGPMGFELMPMRAWVLPGAGNESDGSMHSGYYEYFTVDIRESDLNAEIEAPKYEAVFPAGPDMPVIKSKKR